MPPLTKTTRKFLDWRSWLEGMYVNAIKSATGAILTFAGTNTAEAIAPTALAHVGLNWKQAVAAAGTIFAFEVIRYINAKPLPETVSADASTPPIPPAS